ncbi:flavin-containing monooxygenase [Kineococcus sp. SYSU DK001]|uniref:flavin-containing monooxygenase n=1 Tax=Kineococcus sp. SYSU DK001 TaxID=3383122 RepID=UPI003D7D92BB
MSTADQTQVHDVVIIGAGFAGIGTACALRRRGVEDFVLLERAQDVGGTWRDNHYPGAACDVPSHLYSFSFRLNPDWSRTFAPQGEILDYVRETAREEGVLPRVRFGADVEQVTWDEAASQWELRAGGQTHRARFVVSAVGHLSDPKYPAIRGLHDFGGQLMHSAQWDDAVDLRGKRVGVIGTGASAIQVVPSIAGAVSELVVFQRSAPYVTPRPDKEYTAAEKRMFARVPEAMRAERRGIFWANEERYAQRRMTPALVEAVQRAALDHLASQVPAGELRDALTPDYVIGCKRILKSDDYYPAFLRENVALETTGIDSIEEAGVRLTDGRLVELDVLIACTGFETTELPIAERVRGRDGQLLADRWSKGMEAYATTAVHGFPNFWLVNGPNTGLGHNSSVYVAEAQIEHIGAAVEEGVRTGRVLEVLDSVEQDYTRQLDEMSRGTVWLDGGCRSWYVDHRSNRLTTLWPDFAFSFREVNSPFDPAPYGLDGTTDDTGAGAQRLAGLLETS